MIVTFCGRSFCGRNAFLFAPVTVVASALLLTTVVGCASTRHSPDEVRLVMPVGDPELGEVAFRSLGCGSCHSVEGQPELSTAGRRTQAPTLVRGNPRIKSGQWASAIIAPSHEANWTPDPLRSDDPQLEMPTFFDDMTVGELIDLVAFLDRAPSQR